MAAMSAFDHAKEAIRSANRKWLVTGAAGFIGSNLVESLLALDQEVVGLDNLSAGFRKNLEEIQGGVTEPQWKRFRFVEGDISDAAVCSDACADVDFVLHQAALCSVPWSIADPILANASNIDGFLNMLVASRDAGVRRFVYAASSATYGDDPELPKVEDRIGRPLSPYAVTKYVNELYADVFGRCYGMENIGLRYFNVFGRRQDPEGAYAAVIPKWISSMIRNEPVHIYGDGETSRDFCYIDNVVQANLLAAVTDNPEAVNQVYNVAVGVRTTLNELWASLHSILTPRFPHVAELSPIYRDFREGDVRHSLADIEKAGGLLGYIPEYQLQDGLAHAIAWYIDAFQEV